MCGLCAALNASRNWTDLAGKSEFSLDGRPVNVRQERNQLVGVVNRVLAHYGVSVSDWGGSSYVVTNQRRQNENVLNLNGVWAAVDALMEHERPDPLDERFLDQLDARHSEQQ